MVMHSHSKLVCDEIFIESIIIIIKCLITDATLKGIIIEVYVECFIYDICIHIYNIYFT